MSKLSSNHLFWLMLSLVVLVFAANLCLPLFGISPSDRGTFGDQFGAANALFSGLAFVGLIYTIILQRNDLALQRQDLRLQRDELALTRSELERQTRQFEEQNKTLRVQRFENTFFQMLSQFQDVVNNLSYSYQDGQDTVDVTGREIFYVAFERLPHFTTVNSRDVLCQGMRGLLSVKGLDGYVESNTPTYFDHYFRLLYRILRYIKESPLVDTFDEEYEYAAILRSLLSRYELVWLYYNTLSEYGRQKMKPLVERYAMLKNLRDDLLVDTDKVSGAFSSSAYVRVKR